MEKIIEIINNKKKLFDHSNSKYYMIEISDKVKLLFTASEINKAFERYKKWNKL